ncbi:hypothetical protein SAMN05192533_11519 [Mesobacillus persicus]|uniref:Uncharacterized protein n=1 Tax=Mesobacillus persicus TaxID=930146 RepID=A0A1H8HH44_9BACI|nr:permease prefix domain 1-containing protein [Mesobacillus persicus]SEN55473.1 hypothetical protein SAMN05192533_11519 [Mesobacillus persicus]
MKSNFEQYVEKIICQTDCNREEKKDMYEELIIHLELSRDELMSQGLSERDAEIKAMQLFGIEEEIGSELQQSFFPYRKELILTLSLASFIYSIGLYLLALFAEGNAHIGWLVTSMSVNSLLLLVGLNQIAPLNRRSWLNSLFIINILAFLYGYAILSVLEHPAHLPLVISNWILILLTLVLIYQTTTYGIKSQGKTVEELKRLHQLNFISGIAIIGFSVFFISVGLMLFGGFHLYMIPMIIPFCLWSLSYYGQMKMVEKHKRAAYLLAIFSILISVFILLKAFLPLGVFR